MAGTTENIKFEHTKAVLEQFAKEVVELYKTLAVRDDAYTQGHHFLKDAADVHTVSISDGKILVSIDLAEYWKYVEDGRQAYGENYKGHLPPIQAIQDWITWKPYIPGNTKRGVGNYSSVTPVLSDLNVETSTQNLAWAIATNIAKRGIEARPILKESVEESLKGFKKRLAEALAKDVQETTAGIVASIFGGSEKVEKVDGKWQSVDITNTIVI